MGSWWSKLTTLFESFSHADPTRIVMLGLDAAGKTTVLYKVKLNEVVSTIPTIGFNVETVEPVRGVTFTVWDVGGQEKIRGLWRHYYQNTEGLIFVVDSCDRARLSESKGELFSILDNPDMNGIPFVVFANKQDMNDPLKPYEMIDALDLRKLSHNHKWHVQGTVAPSGDGVYEGMEMLAKMVKEYRKERR